MVDGSALVLMLYGASDESREVAGQKRVAVPPLDWLY